jgi:hypothetical protein
MNGYFRGSRLSAATVSLDELLHFGDCVVTLQEFIIQGLSGYVPFGAAHKIEVAAILYEGFRTRSPVRDIARKMQHAFELDRWESIDFVSAQLKRLSSALDRERQWDAGIRKFRWRWSGALDEVMEHKMRDGEIYDWLKPEDKGISIPRDDMPGMKTNCSCRAQAVIDLD